MVANYPPPSKDNISGSRVLYEWRLLFGSAICIVHFSGAGTELISMPPDGYLNEGERPNMFVW